MFNFFKKEKSKEINTGKSKRNIIDIDTALRDIDTKISDLNEAIMEDECSSFTLDKFISLVERELSDNSTLMQFERMNQLSDIGRSVYCLNKAKNINICISTRGEYIYLFKVVHGTYDTVGNQERLYVDFGSIEIEDKIHIVDNIRQLLYKITGNIMNYEYQVKKKEKIKNIIHEFKLIVRGFKNENK